MQECLAPWKQTGWLKTVWTLIINAVYGYPVVKNISQTKERAIDQC